MARNVGSIEVTVDANTGKLRAKIVKAGEEAGKAGGKAIEEGLSDVDGRELIAKLDKIKLQAEKALSGVEMELGFDNAKAKAELRKFEAQIKALDLTLNIDTKVDPTLQAKLRELQARIGNITINVDGSLNRTEFQAIKRRAEALLGDISVEVDVDVELAKARAAIAQFEAFVDEGADMPIDADLRKARVAIELFRTLQENNDLTIPIDFDIDRLDAKLAEVEARAAAGGGDAGNSFTNAFRDSSGKGFSFLPGQFKEWLPLVTAALEPLLPAVQGLVGGALQVASSAFSALGGAAGAAAPLVAGLGATLGAVVIGSLGVGKAISAVVKEFSAAADEGRAFNFQAEAIQKTLGNLGPAAQGVVKAFADLFPQLRSIQNLVAESLFRGLGDELRALSQETIPDIGASLVRAGATANRFFRELSSAAREIDFAGTFAAVEPALDSLGRAIANVVRAIEPFLKAAAPAARELAQWIEQGSEALLRMVRSGAQSGAITRFLQEGVASLKDWAQLAESVGKALFTLFQQGKAGGDGMVQSLTRVVDKWTEWMQSAAGSEALNDFFRTSRQLLSDMIPLVKGLADGIAALFTGAAEASFANLAEGLGTIVRVIGELIGVLNQANITGAFVNAISILAKALEGVLPQLERFIAAFGDSFTAALGGIASILAPIITLLGNLVGALTPLAPLIAGVATAWIAWRTVTAVISAVEGALTGLNVPMLAIGAAIGVAVFAFQAWGAEAKEVAARAHEVADALETQINALLETATSATSAQLGLDALAKALSSAGEDGEKLTSSLGTLGKTADDSLNVLQSFGTEGQNATKALTELAHSAGLTGAGVADLVDKVASAEDPFFGVSEANTMLAEKLGISTDELARVGHAMEEVQDQAEKTDLQQMTREFISQRGAADENTAALLKQAEATTGISRTADDVLPLYNEFTRLLGEQAAAANEASSTNTGLSDSTVELTGAMIKLDAAVTPIKDAIFGLAPAMSDTDAAMRAIGQSAEAAASAADAMGKAIDKLISPALDAESALSDYRAAVDDLGKSLKDNGTSLDLNTEKGRANREQIRTNIEAIAAYGEAAIKGGDDAAHVTQSMNDMRAELVNQVAAFTGSTEAAEAYVNQLGLTPESISTIVNTPGLLEASNAVLDYDFDLDGVPDNVDTEFTAANLDAVKTKLSEYGIDLSQVPDEVLTQFLQQNWDQVHGQAQTLGTEMQTITDTPAVATVTAPTIPGVQQQIADTAAGMFGLGQTTATPTVNAQGVEETNTQVDGIKTDMSDLDTTTASPSVDLIGNLVVLAVLGEIKKQVEALDKMKAAPDVKIPNFGLVVGQVAVMTALLTQLGNQKPTPQVTLPTFPTVVGQVIVMNALLAQLSAQRATPSVTLVNYGTVIGQILALGVAVAGLDRMSASVSVSAPGLNETINGFRTLNNLITSTNGRVATVTTRNVTINSTQQGMAGALITSPMNMNVGERGLREALIPLDLPLSRVNPNVRGMAEMLRGEGGVPAAGSIGRQVNVTNNIEVVSSSADPVAVATQVVNRAAAMAN